MTVDFTPYGESLEDVVSHGNERGSDIRFLAELLGRLASVKVKVGGHELPILRTVASLSAWLTLLALVLYLLSLVVKGVLYRMELEKLASALREWGSLSDEDKAEAFVIMLRALRLKGIKRFPYETYTDMLSRLIREGIVDNLLSSVNIERSNRAIIELIYKAKDTYLRLRFREGRY